jgi:hypothetical protein
MRPLAGRLVRVRVLVLVLVNTHGLKSRLFRVGFSLVFSCVICSSGVVGCKCVSLRLRLKIGLV